MRLSFSGLYNGVADRMVPAGVAFDSLNADFQRGDVGPMEALLRFQATPEATAGSARGMHYAQHGTAQEILSFVKVGSIVKLKHFNVVTSTWTGITVNGADALVEDAGGWFFTQFLDKIYCLSKVAGLYVHTIGATTGDAAWKLFDAEFEFGEGFAAEFDGAPYQVRDYKAGDSLQFASSYGGAWSYGIDTGNNVGYITRGTLSTGSDWDLQWSIIYGDYVETDLAEYVYIRQDAVEAWIGTNFYGDPDPGAVWVTIDGTTWVSCTVEVKGVTVRGNGTSNDIGIRFKIPKSFVSANGGKIKGIRFKSYYGINSNLSINIFPVVFGGSDLWAMGTASNVDYTIPVMTYAASYYNPTTVTWKPPYIFTVGDGIGQGTSGGRDTSPLGGRVKLTGVPNTTFRDAGFTKIRLYKKHTNGNWYQIAEVANSTSVITPAYDTYSLGDLTTIGIVGTLPASGFDIDFIPECIATWKGHLVIGGNGKAYFSRGGNPGRFLPSPEVDYIPPNIDDVEQPRTLYLSQDRSESVKVIVPDDQVFFVCEKGNYTMVGDSAFDATKSRFMRGSRPGLGKKASGLGDQGTLIAAQDGLYQQAVTRALTASSDALFQSQELTRTIRDSWAWLTSAGSSQIVVSTLWDEVWAVCQDRAVRLSGVDAQGRPSWSKHNLAEYITGTSTAVSAFEFKYHPAIGGLMQGTNGVIYKVPSRVTPLGTTGLAWFVKSPWINSSREAINAISVTAEGALTIEIELDRGAKGILTKTFTLASAKKFVKNLSVPPAYSWRIKISGGATSRFYFADFLTENATLGVGG
jgi:hypothetical protein